MNEHTNPTKRLTKVLRKGRAKAFGSGEAFYAAFEQAIARTKEDIDTLYIRKDEAVKQIEELREHIAALKIELDDMERTHMKLPLDVDGVPIRPGDKLEYVPDGWRFDADGIEINGSVAYVKPNGQARVLAHNCRHVQPDTVETLLRAFTDDVLEWASKSGSVSEVPTWAEISQPYAEKIREVAMIDPKYRFLLHDEALTNRDKRIADLEQLCRDLWVYAMRPHHGGVDGESLFYRMQDLELLEGEHYE